MTPLDLVHVWKSPLWSLAEQPALSKVRFGARSFCCPLQRDHNGRQIKSYQLTQPSAPRLYTHKNDTADFPQTQHSHSAVFRGADLQIFQEVINNFLSSMAVRLSSRATHMIVSFDQSERTQSSNSKSPRCSCRLAWALFPVTVEVCIPPKLHKALK